MLLRRLAGFGAGALLLGDAVGVGIAQAAPEVRIEPRLALVYDTNVARSSQALAEARGLKRVDFVTTPGLDLAVELPVGSQMLFLNGELAHEFHARNEQLNGSRLLLDGGMRLRLSRCNATLLGSYARQRSELGDIFDTAPVENTETVRTVALRGRCGGAIGLAPTFELSRSWSDNSQELREFSNLNSSIASAGIAYTRPSFGELSIVGELRRIRYPNRSQFAEMIDGYRQQSLGARFERTIGSRLQTKVGLFRTSVEADRGGIDFSGLTANAEIGYRISDRFQSQFTWARDVRQANLGTGDYVVASDLGARGEYRLSQRLSFHAGSGFQKRRTEGDGLPMFTQLIAERRYTGFGRLMYTRNNRASADLEIRREVRKANPDLFDYSSTQVMMNFRYVL